MVTRKKAAADGKSLSVKAFMEDNKPGSRGKFSAKPLDEQLAIIDKAQAQLQTQSLVSADMAALEKAKAVFIFRENSFLNAISAKLKECSGDDFCTITIPAGTENLSSQDRKKLNEAYEVLKRRRLAYEAQGNNEFWPEIKIDQTMRDLDGDISIPKMSQGKPYAETISLTFNRELFAASKYDEEYNGSEAARAEFSFVIKEAAKQAKERGAESLIVVLGKDYGTECIQYALYSHGSPLHNSDRLNSDEYKELYLFISNTAGKHGLKTYPALSRFAELVVFGTIDDIELVNQGSSIEVFGINKENIQNLDMGKQALFADRHYKDKDGWNECLIVFAKHEGSIVENVSREFPYHSEFLPICDIDGKNDVDTGKNDIDTFVGRIRKGLGI
ncbi:MAG: hypothetical protein NT051_03765 [Candidatus Micrarchaeota archaeon]|nr:hypothetical protein [Candidatus Micrarchaeota archaeon]